MGVDALSGGGERAHPLGGVTAGNSDTVSFEDPELQSPFAIADVSQAARQSSHPPAPRAWWDRGVPSIPNYLGEFLRPQDRVFLKLRGIDAYVQYVHLQQRLDNYTCFLRVDVYARFPGMEALASRLIEDALSGTISEDDLQEAASWGNPLVFELGCKANNEGSLSLDLLDLDSSRANLAAWRKNWARLNSLFLDLARVRFLLRETERSEIARQLWEEIETISPRAPSRESFFKGTPDPLDYMLCQVLALAEIDNDVSSSLLSEIERGSTLACFVAGLSGNAHYYDACETAYRNVEQLTLSFQEEPYRSRKLAAAWGMMAIDPEASATELLRSMRRFPDASLISLMGFTRSEEVAAYLGPLLEVEDLATRIPNSHFGDQTRKELRRALAALELRLTPTDYLSLR